MPRTGRVRRRSRPRSAVGRRRICTTERGSGWKRPGLPGRRCMCTMRWGAWRPNTAPMERRRRARPATWWRTIWGRRGWRRTRMPTSWRGTTTCRLAKRSRRTRRAATACGDRNGTPCTRSSPAKNGRRRRGWITFGARYYGSALGRFTTPDSVGDGLDPVPVAWANFENPQSSNLYAYVRNNPVANSDPDGNDCVVQTRTDYDKETVTVSSGNCDNVNVEDGQTKTYIAGTVDVSSIQSNGSGGITFGYTPYEGGGGVADLQGDNLAGTTSESLWAEPQDSGKYVLKNVPFYAKGLSCEAEQSDGNLLFKRVVQHNEHSTYRVYARQGGSYWKSEPATDKLVGIDVLPKADFYKIYAALSEAEQAGRLIYKRVILGMQEGPEL